MINEIKNRRQNIIPIIENTEHSKEMLQYFEEQAKYAISNIKYRCTKFNPEYLTIENLFNLQKNSDAKCPACKNDFDYTTKGQRDRHCSIDLFDCELGYVEGNVNLLCMRCNRIKNNTTLKELIQIYNWLEYKIKEDPTGFEPAPIPA